MAKKVKNILKTIVDILTIIIFIILVLIIFCKVKMLFTDKEYFDFFGYSIFRVETGSMEPVIKQNDIIIVRKQDNYSVKDIVTFKSEKEYVTHRIVSKRGDTIVTKGDANNTKDVAIEISQVVGKVVKILPQAGIWQRVFSSPKIIIMIFITLMLFDFAFSYKGIQKKQLIKLIDKVEKKDVKFEEVKTLEDSPKMSDKEIVELYKKTDMIKEGEEVKLDKKEKDFLNYTVRLDLNELQKRIDDKMNEE